MFSSGEASPRLTDDGYSAEPIANGEAAPIIADNAMMGETDLGSAEHGAAASLVSSPASLAPGCDADAAVPKAEYRATDEANSTAQPKHGVATAEHAARVQTMLAEAGSVLSRETLAGPLRPETLLGPLRPGAGCSVREQPAKGGVDDSSMPWSDVDECDLDSVFGWT